MFPDLDDYRLFVRRANTLIPDAIDEATPERLRKARDEFHSMQASTKRKRLAADVEIKVQ